MMVTKGSQRKSIEDNKKESRTQTRKRQKEKEKVEDYIQRYTKEKDKK